MAEGQMEFWGAVFGARASNETVMPHNDALRAAIVKEYQGGG